MKAVIDIAFAFGILYGSLGVVVARFLVPVRSITFRNNLKDMAHVWVGFLFGVAVCNGVMIWEDGDATNFGVNWYLWSLPVGLTVLEVVAAIVRKPKAK